MKRILTYLVNGLAFIGIVALSVPFILSLNPSERVDASLPRVDLSSLEPGRHRTVRNPKLPEYYDGIVWSVLLIKKKDGQVKAWVIPTKNNTVMMPDIHWWRPMTPCETFGPTKLNGLIDEEAPIKCHDDSVPEWWADKWQWSIDGKNLSDQVDDMEPAVGVVEHGYFVLGKRS
jgi:hypothetical protein